MLLGDPRSLHAKEIQESLEPRPSIALTLTTAIEPLEQDTLAPVEELAETG